MSNFLRNIVRVNTIKGFKMSQTMGMRAGTRSLWHMSKPATPITMKHKCSGIVGCNCGCGVRFASSNCEKALVDFLQEEIAAEKKDLPTHLPSQLGGFQIKFDHAEVELTKQSGDEKIVIKFNVNHTLENEEKHNAEEEQTFEQDQEDTPFFKSKPNFEVDLVKKDTTLSLSCMFLEEELSEENADVFGLQELLIYKGEHQEKVYACGADILDGYFYDLLMNLLAEKGVTDKFAVELSELATQYEKSLFVNLLENTKKFLESK